jgi:amino acid transporter
MADLRDGGVTKGAVPPAPDSAPRMQKLHRQNLSGLGVLAQSVGEIAPSACVGAVVVLVIETTGPASWVTWAVGGAVLLVVAYVLTQLTSRFETSGGLYAMAARAGGPAFGYLTAWMAIVAYLAGLIAVVYQIAELMAGYLNLQAIGIPYNSFTTLVIGLVGICLAGYCSYYNVKVSARVMLVLEALSMLCIIVLMMIVLFTHKGTLFSPVELHFHGSSWHAILLAIPLVMFSFAGFESASFLGQEAKDSRRTISIAVIGSVAVASVFFVFCAYVMELAFQGTRLNPAASSNLLASVANISGVSWYGYIVGIGVILSMFAVIIAVFNAGSRLLFTLSNEGFLPKPLSRAHPKHGTPSFAVGFIGLGCTFGVVLVAVLRANVVNALNNTGTLSGDGEVMMLLLTVVAVAVMFLRKRYGSTTSKAPVIITAAIVATIALAYLLYKSFIPYPAFPANFPDDICVGVFVPAVLMLASLVRRKSPLLLRTGSSNRSRPPKRSCSRPGHPSRQPKRRCFWTHCW